jgi:hypothetical protein
MSNEVTTAAPWRPVVYMSVDDAATRARIADTLQRLGWTVIEQASGFHILGALADVIEAEGVNARAAMIVVDEVSRGCSGATLACGLRDLGCSIPVVLIRSPWSAQASRAYGTGVYVVDHAQAASVLAELVRPWSPISLSQLVPARERATA